MPDQAASEMTADTLQVNSPALSATSDAPQPAEGPPLSESVNNVALDNAQAEDETGDTVADKEAGAEVKEPKPDLTPPAVKREITKARNAERAAKALAEQTQANLDRALEALQRVTKPEPEKTDPEPTRDAFNDPDAYQEARDAWVAKRAATQAVAEANQARAKADQASRAKALTESWQSRKAEFMADHPDYEDVAEEADENGRDLVAISIPMAHAIMNADDGPAVAYWLGQNRAEAARIAKLEPVQAVVEIGRISAKLSEPAAPRTRKPAPITPVGNRSSASAKNPSEMTTEEYAASIAHRLPFGTTRAAVN